MVDRIKTYIEGFDEQLDGGIPKGHIVMLCGTPGTMKSSTAFHILFQNAMLDQIRTLYISLEESKTQLLNSMSELGMKVKGDTKLFI